jgi:hypothetical protein
VITTIGGDWFGLAMSGIEMRSLTIVCLLKIEESKNERNWDNREENCHAKFGVNWESWILLGSAALFQFSNAYIVQVHHNIQ